MQMREAKGTEKTLHLLLVLLQSSFHVYSLQQRCPDQAETHIWYWFYKYRKKNINSDEALAIDDIPELFPFFVTHQYAINSVTLLCRPRSLRQPRFAIVMIRTWQDKSYSLYSSVWPQYLPRLPRQRDAPDGQPASHPPFLPSLLFHPLNLILWVVAAMILPTCDVDLSWWPYMSQVPDPDIQGHDLGIIAVYRSYIRAFTVYIQPPRTLNTLRHTRAPSPHPPPCPPSSDTHARNPPPLTNPQPHPPLPSLLKHMRNPPSPTRPPLLHSPLLNTK